MPETWRTASYSGGGGCVSVAAPERHDPPAVYICLDEWRDNTAVCVCQLPDGHGEDWHECRCGKTWQEDPRA